MPCNLIHIEDDREHRTLLRDYFQEKNYPINSYRDVSTFKAACEDGTVRKGFTDAFRTVIILDIMLAYRLAEHRNIAPTQYDRNPIQADEATDPVDYNLGIQVAEDIRESLFLNIPKDVPVLFLSARDNPFVRKRISKIDRSSSLVKPVFCDEIETKIEELLSVF